MLKALIIGTLVLAVFGAAFIAYRFTMKSNYTASLPTVQNPSSMSVNSGNPQTNSSDTQLDADLNSINSQMNGVATEQTGIDAGLNQQAPNLQ